MTDEGGPLLFWNAVSDLHRGRPEEASVHRLREILEPVWQFAPRWRSYPLANQLLTTWRSSALVHLARRLDEFVRIERHERVLRRLGSPNSYPTAHHEVDFALKVPLAGHRCRYVPEGKTSVPDLLVPVDNGYCSVEVTSLNPPHADELAQRLASFIEDVALETRTSFDGSIRIPRTRPSNRDVSALEGSIRETADRAGTEATALALSEPTVTARFVSPKAAQYFGRRGSTLDIEYPDRPGKARKLARTIEAKARKQLSRARSAALVVYDRFLSAEDEDQLGRHDLSTTLIGSPSLAGVILLHPFPLWGERTIGYETWVDKTTFHGRYPLPDWEAESFVAWTNPANAMGIKPLVSSVIGYPGNLCRLYREPSRRDSPADKTGARVSRGGSSP